MTPVAVVILNWNNTDETRACLASLRDVEYPNLSVFVIDNGSTLTDWASLHSEVPDGNFIRNPENLGFAGGCNVGIGKALERGAEHVVLLNNDARVEPNFIRELVRCVDSVPQAGICAPKIVDFDPPHRIQAAGGRISLIRGRAVPRGWRRRSDRYPHDAVTEFAPGAAVLVRREVFERVGLLDESLFLYFEDVDLCLRARRAGFKIVYTGNTTVRHKISGSSGGRMNERSFAYSIRNGYYLAAREDRWTRWAHAVYMLAWFVVAVVPYATWTRRPQLIGAFLTGKRQFHAGRTGRL